MSIGDPAGYSEAAAQVFTWLADKVLGGASKALGWGWGRAKWAAAQDRYDAQIIKHYGEIRIFGQTTPKSLREIFTDVFVLDRPTAMRRFDPEAVLDHLWNKDRGEPWRSSERLPAEEILTRGDKFFILGRPGAGKTTFLKRLAVREAQRGAWGRCLGKIPIFVSLKQFAEAKSPLLDYIVDQFAVCHFPDAAPFVELLLKSGKALVLFDGLDEVTKAADAKADKRGQVTQMIEQFVRQYDGCHVVVTCRIAATEYTFPPPFVYLEMADFAPEQVDAFVRGWFWDAETPDESAALAEKMLAEWGRPEHEGIRDLGRNPLLLTLLCLSYAETLSFPTRRAEIYDEALQALLKKWDISRRIERTSVYKSLSVGRKQQMFARIAYDGFIQNEILFSRENLETRLKAYVVHVPGMPEPIDIDAALVLQEIIEQHGLFAEQSRGLYSFAHLTFQEYYTAQYIKESVAPEALDTLMARVGDDRWREIFLLTAEMLPDATQFLTAFEGRLHPLAASRQYLAAWLRSIDEEAEAVRAGYSRFATRLFLARALELGLEEDLDRALDAAFDCAVACDRDLARDRDLAIVRDRARDRALAHIRDRARVRDRDHARDRELARALEVEKENLLGLCQRQGRTALYAAISALEMPDAEAPEQALLRYVSELTRVIEARDLARYHQLEVDADAFAVKDGYRWPLGFVDVEPLIVYINASRLLYDCLQVAYTPERHKFEERLFSGRSKG